MRQIVVQFDVDGVLADFDAGYRRVYEEVHGDKIVRDPSTWRWNDSKDNATWDAIRSLPLFWQGLPSLVDLDTLARIATLASEYPVYFITHRHGVKLKQQTESWLYSYGVKNPTVVVSGRKEEAAKANGASHAIDDKAGNAYVVSLLPGVKSYLLDAPYNQMDHSVIGGSVRRIDSVRHFLDAVNKDIFKQAQEATK